jgi:hypothetical protein
MKINEQLMIFGDEPTAIVTSGNDAEFVRIGHEKFLYQRENPQKR